MLVLLFIIIVFIIVIVFIINFNLGSDWIYLHTSEVVFICNQSSALEINLFQFSKNFHCFVVVVVVVVVVVAVVVVVVVVVVAVEIHSYFNEYFLFRSFALT